MRIRVTDSDLQRWQAAAAGKGVKNLSRWMRALANQAAACGEDPLEWRRSLAAMLRDLNSGVGNNLNQVARGVASGSADRPSAMALIRMADDLAGLRLDIRAHLLGGLPTVRRASRR